MKPGAIEHRPIALGIRLISSLSMSFGLTVGAGQAAATEASSRCSFGIQAGLAFPAGEDLKVTAGSRMNAAIGIHATWDIDEHQRIRPRLDLWNFGRSHQEVLTPLAQRIETKVQGIAFGGEYLFRPSGLRGRLAAGAGLYAIHWSVNSTNHLAGTAGGTTQASGTSHWTKGGCGLVVSYRLAQKLDVEARWIFSRYGYENLPANLSSFGLLWRF